MGLSGFVLGTESTQPCRSHESELDPRAAPRLRTGYLQCNPSYLLRCANAPLTSLGTHAAIWTQTNELGDRNRDFELLKGLLSSIPARRFEGMPNHLQAISRSSRSRGLSLSLSFEFTNFIFTRGGTAKSTSRNAVTNFMLL